MERFTGTVARIGEVEVGGLVDWITAIPFEDWPQQTPIDDQLRPAMVKDPTWHGFANAVSGVVAVLSDHPVTNVMLTVVMPGHDIPPHVDQQPAHWLARVHVPLTSNNESQFMVGGEHHHMEIGSAYIVNTTVEHAVRNDGTTPRIHLMWDLLNA